MFGLLAKTKKIMKYLKLSLISILTIFLSCQNEPSNKLQGNQIFTPSETAEIISLLNKFDDEICKIESTSGEDILACYHSFFERILKGVESGNIEIGISEKSQREIVESLNPDLRNEFWGYGKGVLNRRIPNTNLSEIFPDTVKYIHLTKGKYFEYLIKEVSELDPKTKQYFEKLNKVMDSSSPSIVADIIKNYSEYDITDERIRLLIAIHYLTMNHEHLERVASYARLRTDIENEFKKKINKIEASMDSSK